MTVSAMTTGLRMLITALLFRTVKASSIAQTLRPNAHLARILQHNLICLELFRRRLL